MPATWEGHSKMYLGYVARPSLINQRYVTAKKVQNLLDQGKTDYQIGLIYNGGEIKEKKGVNRYGVRYDSGAYARKLVKNIISLAKI